MILMKTGIFAIYKQKGPTSHDIIRELRRITGIKKIGHAGTLDPLASGVLVVGIGREATKKLGEIVKKEKEYIGIIKLGEVSTTFDSEGEKIQISIKKKPTLINIEKIIKKFIGEIKQTPPIYSAIKIDGEKAYQMARRGIKFKLKPRIVSIKEIEILRYKWPLLKIKIICGPGTYVRSIANDIGKEIKTGGYLSSLERTRVGSFKINKAIKICKIV